MFHFLLIRNCNGFVFAIFRSLPEVPFRGLSNVTYLGIGDNELEEIPKHVLSHMPLLQTLDIGRGNIRAVQQDDFRGIQAVTNLILPSNNITRLDKGSFPRSLLILHLGRNRLETLNGTLLDLDKLQSLFINANNISTLDNELPDGSKLRLLMAHNNRLERLPANMAEMDELETVHIQSNRLRSLDRVFRNAVNLQEFQAENNELEFLAQDEFASCYQIDNLLMSCNHIRSLNSSLLPILKLKRANFSFNDMEEFSMGEIHGLRSLKFLVLSNNRIQRLLPDPRGIQKMLLVELYLDQNRIEALNGALAGLGNLRILNLASNRLEHLQEGDFYGLQRLEILDLTGNQLVDLKPMETVSVLMFIIEIYFIEKCLVSPDHIAQLKDTQCGVQQHYQAGAGLQGPTRSVPGQLDQQPDIVHLERPRHKHALQEPQCARKAGDKSRW